VKKPTAKPRTSDGGSGAPAYVRKLTVIIKALAEESRLRILFMLSEHGEMSVSAIGGQLKQSQPAVSHHLAQLKNCGLVDYRRDGKFNYYALNPKGLDDLLATLFPNGGPMRLGLGNVEIGFKAR